MRPYLLLFVMAAFGCQPETDTVSPADTSTAGLQTPLVTPAPVANFRLKQLVLDGNAAGLGPYFVTTRFEYDKGRNLKRAVIPPTSPTAPELMNEYVYDEQGRVSSYQVRYGKPNDDGTVGELNTFLFGENTIEQSFTRVSANGQPLPTTIPRERNIYRVNSDGQITEWVQEDIIRYDRLTRARYVYTYENGNLVKASYRDGTDKVEFTISYQYDDKPNPFYQWMYTIDPVLRSSRNNVVSSQVNGSAPTKKAYTYNESGLPITKMDISSGAVLTYEYESF